MALPKITMTRDEFRGYANKAIAVATIMTTLTPTPRDDEAVALIGHIFTDDEHFGELCDIIGFPPETPTA